MANEKFVDILWQIDESAADSILLKKQVATLQILQDIVLRNNMHETTESKLMNLIERFNQRAEPAKSERKRSRHSPLELRSAAQELSDVNKVLNTVRLNRKNSQNFDTVEVRNEIQRPQTAQISYTERALGSARAESEFTNEIIQPASRRHAKKSYKTGGSTKGKKKKVVKSITEQLIAEAKAEAVEIKNFIKQSSKVSTESDHFPSSFKKLAKHSKSRLQESERTAAKGQVVVKSPRLQELIKFKLTHQQFGDMKRKFHIFDENNEGIITKNEIANLLSSLGEDFTPDVVANILKQAEVGDFYVDFHEFSKTIDPGNNELRFQFGKTQNERISVDPVSKNDGYSKLDLANKKKTRFSGQMKHTSPANMRYGGETRNNLPGIDGQQEKVYTFDGSENDMVNQDQQVERKHFPSDQRQTRHLVDGGGSFENRDSEQDEVVMRATVEQESEFSSPGEEGAAINAAGMELQAVLKSREFGHGPTETEISAVEDELSGKLIQRQNEFFDY